MSEFDHPHHGPQNEREHDHEAQRAPEPQRADARPRSMTILGQVAANIGNAALQRKLARRAIQRREAAEVVGGDGAESTSAIHEAARLGTSGAGQQLPHLEAIQRSFGSHDVSHIEAHLGTAATRGAETMGAEAYATGNQVAFREAPSLHTAAHEAAHVVQQRSGVHLKGGVGAEGDEYERHADAVADGVVRGGSVEGLLDTYATPATTPAVDGPVQRKPGKGGVKDLLTPDPNGEGIGLTAMKWAAKGAWKGGKAAGKAIASAARGVSDSVSGLFDDEAEGGGHDEPYAPDEQELALIKYVQSKVGGHPSTVVGYYQEKVKGDMASAVYAPLKQTYLDEGMTEEDIEWVLFYTDNPSYALNAVMRGLIKDPAWVEAWMPTVEPIQKALAKVPSGVRNKEFQAQNSPEEAKRLDPNKGDDELISVTKLYRADTLDKHFAPAFIRDYEVGAVLQDPGFLSTTVFKGSYSDGQGGKVAREMDKTPEVGKAIAAMSMKAHENEVLLPPGTQMRINSITELGEHGGAVPKPKKTYKTPEAVIGHSFEVKVEIVQLPPSKHGEKAPKKGSKKKDALGERLANSPKQI